MKKNLKFAAAALATFFVFSCASTPKPENNSAQSGPQTVQNSNDESSVQEKEESQTSENEQKNSDETPKEENQDSNPPEKMAGQNVSNEEFPKSSANQNLNLNQNPPKVQTAPAPRQPNYGTEKKSKSEDINQISTENPENQNDAPAEKISESDLISSLENELAPTADEKNKVSEPSVSDFFEEPEVIEVEPEEQPDEILEPQDHSNENQKISEQNPAETTKKEETEKIKAAAESRPAEIENDAEAKEENTETADAPAFDSENPETEENKKDESKPGEIIPSRSVTVKQNQYLDVVYPGNGWIYLGENDTALLRYFGRQTENGATTFSFRSINTGKTGNSILHFYKNDVLTEKYIDDYLEVIVTGEAAEGTEKATAPSYAEIVPPRLERRKTEAKETFLSEQISKDSNKNSSRPENFSLAAAKNQSGQNSQKSPVLSSAQKTSLNDSLKTVISNSDSGQKQNSSQNQQSRSENFYTADKSLNSNAGVEAEPEVQISENAGSQADFTDDSILEKAKQLFDEKKYPESLENVKNFINSAPKRLDEAYYLLGQLYESDSSIKNIRNAVDAYETVTRDFPLSKLWKNASERSIYLKRFYIDIR